jgi:hypothetical protein
MYSIIFCDVTPYNLVEVYKRSRGSTASIFRVEEYTEQQAESVLPRQNLGARRRREQVPSKFGKLVP